MIDRRTLLAHFAAGVVAGPLAARAQAPAGKSARIGYLSIRSGPSYLDEAFRQGLRELGYVEGRDLSIEYRWADWKAERASALAADLVHLKVNVIVSTGGVTSATAARDATKTIPIVFTMGDPVGAGLVTRLDRPGGNMTGINILTLVLNPKRLDLLKTALPGVTRVAVLANPTVSTTAMTLDDLQTAARSLRVKLQVLEVRDPRELEGAFAAMVRERAEALLVASDPMLFAQRELIVSLAAKHRLPGIFEWREFAEAGGLLSYGANLAEMYRRLASYVDKILKGAKPGELPVEQPTTFDLVINLKTAKALGLTIPRSVLDRADLVIPP